MVIDPLTTIARASHGISSLPRSVLHSKQCFWDPHHTDNPSLVDCIIQEAEQSSEIDLFRLLSQD